MAESSVAISEATKEDLAFFFRLWHTAEVMRYAGEFPRLRGWSKKDNFQTVWAAYQEKRVALDRPPAR